MCPAWLCRRTALTSIQWPSQSFAAMEQQQPRPIWDAVDVDLVLHVADLSIFHPLFSMWVPLVILGQARRCGLK